MKPLANIAVYHCLFFVHQTSFFLSCLPPLQFLEECIAGFVKSDYELKHLCLEYMAPWLPNLARFVNVRVALNQIVNKARETFLVGINV